MSKPNIRIFDITTNTTIDREMTDEEYAIWSKDSAEAAERCALIKKAEDDKASAQAKLAALGLTADDLKALGL
jgi:hypothetical protein